MCTLFLTSAKWIPAWFQLKNWNTPARVGSAQNLFSSAQLSLGNFSSNPSLVHTVLSKSNKNLTSLLVFSGYCGIQYNTYSATNPDAFVLDDVTKTSVNVSCNTKSYETNRNESSFLLYLPMFWSVWQLRAAVEHNLSLSQNTPISWYTYC